MDKTTLSREAWLQRSLDVLREEGIQGVRVERLARDLGVTKGSFYWHFDDRDDLHRSLLKFWVERFNDVVTENPAFQSADPAAGLLEAITKVREEELDKYELAIRAWAEHDSEAGKTVRDLYERRATFIRSFFSRIGFRGLDAEIRTRLTLCFLSWDPSMHPDESESRRLKLLKLQHELLTKK
ncbi:MAG: TetR/AcrR family transcriptional regulator [Planctomycetota bacterium]